MSPEPSSIPKWTRRCLRRRQLDAYLRMKARSKARSVLRIAFPGQNIRAIGTWNRTVFDPLKAPLPMMCAKYTPDRTV